MTVQDWLIVTKKYNPKAFDILKRSKKAPPKFQKLQLSEKDKELCTLSNVVYKYLVGGKEVYLKFSGNGFMAQLDRMDEKITQKYLTQEELAFVYIWIQDKQRLNVI